MKILILGVNGFIGSSLSEAILEKTDWEIYGMDMSCHKITECLSHDRFHFVEGDITINKEWIAYHIKKCDVVLPLVAIATPSLYVTDPLKVFELDFESNLDIVRLCVKYNKRVVFPSTSEVYGMCEDAEFNEETSPLITGPIQKQRWIYSCSKQLLDRVIYAYGVHHGLRYTLFRPFNWVGPKLDSLLAAKEGSSRVVTQFISDLLHKQEIKLVDGGKQRRCFTDIRDGIDALMAIIENKENQCDQKIFNIGNPKNDYSIEELAHIVVDAVKRYPAFEKIANATKITVVEANQHYGTHYQDVQRRVPSIQNLKQFLDFEPQYTLEEALALTLDYHLKNKDENLEDE